MLSFLNLVRTSFWSHDRVSIEKFRHYFVKFRSYEQARLRYSKKTTRTNSGSGQWTWITLNVQVDAATRKTFVSRSLRCFQAFRKSLQMGIISNALYFVPYVQFFVLSLIFSLKNVGSDFQGRALLRATGNSPRTWKTKRVVKSHHFFSPSISSNGTHMVFFHQWLLPEEPTINISSNWKKWERITLFQRLLEEFLGHRTAGSTNRFDTVKRWCAGCKQMIVQTMWKRTDAKWTFFVRLRILIKGTLTFWFVAAIIFLDSRGPSNFSNLSRSMFFLWILLDEWTRVSFSKFATAVKEISYAWTTDYVFSNDAVVVSLFREILFSSNQRIERFRHAFFSSAFFTLRWSLNN